MEVEHLALVFKALGDPTRLKLVSLVATAADHEACICDLTEAVHLAQSTVSYHMKQLVDAGLVTRQQRGKWAYYQLDNESLYAAAAAITPAKRQP
jgi:ArsR family transcriptional regulator